MSRTCLLWVVLRVVIGEALSLTDWRSRCVILPSQWFSRLDDGNIGPRELDAIRLALIRILGLNSIPAPKLEQSVDLYLVLLEGVVDQAGLTVEQLRARPEAVAVLEAGQFHPDPAAA